MDIFHSLRVAKLVSLLCEQLELGYGERERIILSAVLHDIGKSMISLDILNKPGKLSPREWYEIEQHPIYGANLAAVMGYDTDIVTNILYHHENYDGSGYPRGLRDKEIPLGASIIRICDSYDAMRSIRPYNRVKTHLEAINELVNTKLIYRGDLLYKFLNIDFHSIEKYYRYP